MTKPTPNPNTTRKSSVNWWRLHLWQLQPVRDVMLVAVIVGIFYLGYLMSVVTVPLLLGLTLAYLFEPIVMRLARRIGRAPAAGLVIAAVLLAIVVPLIFATGFAVVQGAEFVREVRRDLPEIREQLIELRDQAREWGVWPETGETSKTPAEGEQAAQGEGAAAEGEGEQPAEAAATPRIDWWGLLEAWLDQNSAAVGSMVAGSGMDALRLGWKFIAGLGYIAFTGLFLTPLFFFFFSVGFGKVRVFGASMIPERERDKTLTILHKMDRAISGFVRGRITIAAIMSVLLTVGWWLVGVPAPLILGPLTGFVNIVPYLGLVGWVASIIGMWIAEAGMANPLPWWAVLLLPSAVYWTVQTMDDYLLTPLIQGKSTGLSTPMVIVAVFGGAALGGIYGLLLAIPAAACLKILITDVFLPRYKKWVEGQARDFLPIESESSLEREGG